MLPDPVPPWPIDRVLDRLVRRVDVSREDADALRHLVWTERTLRAGTSIARQAGEGVVRPGFVVAGGVIRSRHRADGAKQAVGIALPGDLLSIEALFDLEPIDDITTLRGTRVIETGAADLRRTLAQAPGLAMAFCALLMADLSIAQQWIFCLGKMDAMQRICHFFSEMATRQSADGDALPPARLDLTQDQVADLVGLTPVHVNRMLQLLVKMGCVTVARGAVTLTDIARLRDIGRFDDGYLRPGG